MRSVILFMLTEISLLNNNKYALTKTSSILYTVYFFLHRKYYMSNATIINGHPPPTHSHNSLHDSLLKYYLQDKVDDSPQGKILSSKNILQWQKREFTYIKMQNFAFNLKTIRFLTMYKQEKGWSSYFHSLWYKNRLSSLIRN